jgi:hypothetical protein
MSWDSRFAEPIDLPGGVRLASLRDAIVHLVNTVPSSERGTPVILTAAELITSAAERGGPVEFARIVTLRALNRHLGSGPTHDDFRTTHAGLPNRAAGYKPSVRPNRIYANFVAKNASTRIE